MIKLEYECDNSMETEDFLGEIITSITRKEDSLIFKTLDGQTITMLHEQDCCEDVTIEDICGDLEDLINSPIVMAEAVEQSDPEADESGTWTFYKLGTSMGSVTIRWHGVSNGYYSESVNLRIE